MEKTKLEKAEERLAKAEKELGEMIKKAGGIAERDGMAEEQRESLLREVDRSIDILAKEKYEEYNKARREKLHEKRAAARKEEFEENLKKIKKRDRQILTIELIIGIFGGLTLILFYNNKPWWLIVSLGILTLIIVALLKKRLAEAVPTIGDRLHSRFFFALVCWSLIGYLMTWGVFSIPVFEDVSPLMKSLTFLGLMFLIAGITWKGSTFDVPEWTGINLYNYFTGRQKTFLPGFYFKFFWELVKPESTHSLKSMKEDVEKRSYPTGGGTVLDAELMVQFAPDPFNLITFEGLDNKVIRQGLMEHLSSILLMYIAEEERTARGVRGNIKHLHEEIKDDLGIDENEKRTLENPKNINQLTRSQSPIEKSYGVIIIIAKLSDLDFDKAYQDILTSAKAMDQIEKMADRILKKAGESMEWKEALDKALVIAEKATGNIITTTGDGQALPLVNIGGGKQ